MERNLTWGFYDCMWRFKKIKNDFSRTSLPCFVREIFKFVWYTNLIFMTSHCITNAVFSESVWQQYSKTFYSLSGCDYIWLVVKYIDLSINLSDTLKLILNTHYAVWCPMYDICIKRNLNIFRTKQGSEVLGKLHSVILNAVQHAIITSLGQITENPTCAVMVWSSNIWTRARHLK